MQLPISYRIKEQQLWLSAERCVFWEEESALIVSDLHLGKTGHFRKSGIGVPQTILQEDLHRLVSQIQYFRPRQLLVVGDLFHSRENKELELFKRWRGSFPDLAIRLILGNHDILAESWYGEAGIGLSRDRLAIGGFSFIHDIAGLEGGRALNKAEIEATKNEPAGIAPARDEPAYYFSGHLHPGVLLSGAGRQNLRLPCFYFGEEYAVLPAFSRFTGTASIRPRAHEHVFAILPPGSGGPGNGGSLVRIQ